MVDMLLGNHGARARRVVEEEVNIEVGRVQILRQSIEGKTVHHWDPIPKNEVAIQLTVQSMVDMLLGNHGARARRVVEGDINIEVGRVQILRQSIEGTTVHHWEPMSKAEVAVMLPVQLMVDMQVGNHGARARRLVEGEVNIELGRVQILRQSMEG